MVHKHLFFLLSLTILSCDQKEPFAQPVEFIFKIPMTLAPIQSSYLIGDTLWLNANFSNKIAELNSGNDYYINPTNFSFNTFIGLKKLTYHDKYFSNQPGAINSFEIVNKTGELKISGPTFGDASYKYQNDKHQLSIGIIARDTGVFSISLLDGWIVKKNKPDLSYIDLPNSITGEPQIALFKRIFYYINNGHNNFNLLESNSQLTLFSNPSPDNINYEKEATYTFRIKK